MRFTTYIDDGLWAFEEVMDKSVGNGVAQEVMLIGRIPLLLCGDAVSGAVTCEYATRKSFATLEAE